LALYETFATAWRVTAEDSLFDYAPGGSTDNYTIPGYPAEGELLNIDQLTGEQWQAALDACADVSESALREQCAYDFYVTGNDAFTETYAVTEQVALTGKPTLSEGVREVIFDAERIVGAALADGILFVSYDAAGGVASLTAVDTASGTVLATVPVFRAGALAFAGSPWAVDIVEPGDDCSVSSVDPRTLAAVTSVAVPCGPFGLPGQLAATADAVWYTAPGQPLTRIDAASGATSTFELPLPSGVLQATDSNVFYSDAGSYFTMPSAGGGFTLAASLASHLSAVPGASGIWVATGDSANLVVNEQEVASVALPEGGELVAAASDAVYVELSHVTSSELVRVPTGGGPPAVVMSVADVVTEDGSVSLEYRPEDGSPLVISAGELVRAWLIPSIASPGSSSIAIQTAAVPR
jgi:hypothetical protein